MGQGHAVWRVAEPIHETLDLTGPQTIALMILDENSPAGHPAGLAQKGMGIKGVMQNIDKHDEIEGAIAKGDGLPVIDIHRYMGRAAVVRWARSLARA